MTRIICDYLKYVAVASLFHAFVQTNVCSTILNANEELCVNDLELNRETIEAWNIEPYLPEDNDEIKQYLACYWKKLGYQQENGDFDYVKISEVVHSDLKSRFQSDCLRIAAYVVDVCRTTVEGESDGLRAVRMWNSAEPMVVSKIPKSLFKLC